MKPRCVIWGAGNFAQQVSAQLCTEFEIAGYVVDDSCHQEQQFMGRPCLPFSQLAQKDNLGAEAFFCAIGYGNFNQNRAGCVQKMLAKGLQPISVISRQAIVDDSAQIGPNCYVGPGAIIDAGVHLGSAVTILPGAIIGHDSLLSDNAYICQGVNIPGFVRIGSNSFIGTGAIFSDGVSVGDFCFIKAGEKVFHHCESGKLTSGADARDFFDTWYNKRKTFYTDLLSRQFA